MKSKYSTRTITQIISDYDNLRHVVNNTSQYVYFFVLKKTNGASYGKFYLSFGEGEDGKEIPVIVQQFWNGDAGDIPNGEFSYPASWLNISYEKLEKSLEQNPELKKLAKVVEYVAE